LPRDTITAAGGEEITVGFRPESVELVDESGIEVRVDRVEEVGSDAFVHGELADDGNSIVARVDPRDAPVSGDTLRVRIRPDELHVFSAGSGLRLG
jgi:multiple sugar transport system ATP-binding protein